MAMAIDTKQIMGYIRKGLIFTIKTSFRSARDHPLVLGMLLFLILLYTSFPSFFAILVSFSPVIVSTTLLLGLLLSYGDPNLPEIEPEEETKQTHQASSLKTAAPADDNLVVERDESLVADARLESSSVEEDDEEVGIEEEEEEVVEEREIGDEGLVEEREFFLESLKVKIEKPELEENHLDSSLGSPWLPIDVHRTSSSDSDSDGAESSSPDASMADIIPMLDELHPLIDYEPLQAAVKFGDESDVGSADEEEEEEEAREEKADFNEGVVKWTADDQKNVMDLGISDMERNRRLESLIAKRRSRNYLRSITERNLIDLDDLTHFQVRIPPISAPRQNPFDLPCDSDHIPLSAPSVMQPRKNPFDLTFELVGQSSSHTTESLSHGEFLSAPVRESFFRKQESFSSEASLSSDLQQENPSSRLKPFFVAEREEGAAFATFQRQLSEMSDSKVSSVPDSDTASSVIDEEHHNELLQEELQQETEVLLPIDHHAEPASRSAKEVDSVDVDHQHSEIIVGDDRGIDLAASFVPEETHQAVDVSRAVEEEIREGEFDLLISDAAKLEVVEDKYDESSYSSSETDGKTSKIRTHEESTNLESAGDDSSKGSNDAIYSFPADSNSATEERVIYSELVDPVFDLSPRSIRKSLSNISNVDEALLGAGDGGFISSSSLVSDVQADISELGSTPMLLEKDISIREVSRSVNENIDLASISGELGLASFDSSSTDINESVLSKISGQHPLSLSTMDTESSKDSPVVVDESCHYEGGEIKDVATSYSDTLVLSDQPSSSTSENVHPSREKFGMAPSSEAGIVEPQIGGMTNLPSIPEENFEEFKLEEEYESMISLTGVVGSTGLQIIEEPGIALSDIEEELSFFQRRSVDETWDIDGTKTLVHEPEDIGASVGSSINSSYDTGLTGIYLLETIKSVGSSSLLDAKSGLEIKSHSTLSDSQSDTIEEVFGERDGGFSKALNGSSDESVEAPDEIREVEEIDEGLLSELNAVGDFRVEEVKSVGDPGIELQSGDQCAGDDANLLIHPVEQDFPTPKSVARESDVASSSWPSGVDPEMTVYNSKLRILEASSFEELDSAFKQLCGEADMPCGSETSSETLAAKIEAVSDERNITDTDPKLSEINLELQILGEKYIKDSSFASEHLSQGGLDDSIFPDVEPPESVPSKMPLEPMEIPSDSEIIDAKTLEAKDLALKQLTDYSVENPLKQMEPEYGSTMDVASERNLEPGVLEAQSAEEIRLAFEAAVARETGSSHGQSGDKNHMNSK